MDSTVEADVYLWVSSCEGGNTNIFSNDRRYGFICLQQTVANSMHNVRAYTQKIGAR